jgi:hypothetical protein
MNDFRPILHIQGPRLPFDRVTLLLPGSVAVGAYQEGVDEAFGEAEIPPCWIAAPVEEAQ